MLLISPALAWPDSQRGDWYDTYNSDGWSYDVPVEAQLTGAGKNNVIKRICNALHIFYFEGTFLVLNSNFIAVLIRHVG
jgi:hypothetical protein